MDSMASRIWLRLSGLTTAACLILSACRAAATEPPATPTVTPSLTVTATDSPTPPPSPTEEAPTAQAYPYPGPQDVLPTLDGAYPGAATPFPTVSVYPGPGEAPEFPSPTTGAYPGPEAFPTPTGGAYPGPAAPPSPFPTSSTGAYPGPAVTTQPSLLPTPNPLTPSPTGVIPTAQPTVTPTRPRPTVPQITVDLRLLATDPDEVELASGRVQLVEFFTFWCYHCRAMIPIMYGLEQEYSSRMNFVYLDLDDPRVREFREALGYRIPPGGIEPQFYLLDAEGEIIKQWRGVVAVEEFQDEIERLLRGPAP